MIGANTTATIRRGTETLDDFGSPVVKWADVVTVPCRFVVGDWHQRESLRAIGGTATVVATHMVFVPADTDIVVGDRIRHRDRDYEVLACDDIDYAGHHIEAHVVRMEGA